MLRGKNVDLNLVEKDDYSKLFEWTEDWDFLGSYWPAIRHRTRQEDTRG